MNSADEQDDAIYTVAVNHEQQYSIWPASRPLPLGWSAAGKTGIKQDCLNHIESVWTDMRPLSVRRSIDETSGQRAVPADGIANEHDPTDASNHVPALVERLVQGRHPARAEVGAEAAATALRDCIERGFVRVVFAHDRGVTLLGLQPDQAASDIRAADFEKATGSVHLEGELTLDGEPVRCVVDLDVATLSGEGCLIRKLSP